MRGCWKSKELKRTHNNIFDWVQKERRVIEEKDRFKEKEEVEIEIEPRDIETISKQERLDRMKMRMKAREESKVCKELVIEFAEGKQ